MKRYSPVLPLEKDEEEGYNMHSDAVSSIRQDLKNLILTNPGERVMMPEYGVGIKFFLFEQASNKISGNLSTKIQQQVSRYMPSIIIDDIQILEMPDSLNAINVIISYFIKNSNAVDTLNLEVQSN